MNLKKILAGVAAGAMVFSSLAMPTFADDAETEVAYTGSYTFSDSSWWTQDVIVDGDVSTLIGDVDPSTVVSVTFTSDTDFYIGYNNTAGDWSQNSTAVTEYVATDIVLESYTDDEEKTHDPYLCLMLSKGDGVEYTINWTVEVAAEEEDEPAAETVSAKAYLNINQSGWGSFDYTEVTADVTGNGTYTVSLTATDTIDLEVFNALEIESGEEVFGHEYIVTIDSIKINGEDVTLLGSSYTCSADGAGVTTRVNIYNAYNDPTTVNEVDEKLGYADQRALEADDYTARLISDTYLTGFNSMEVTFTVSGITEETEDDNTVSGNEADASGGGDTTPVAYLAVVVALAGVALVGSKKARA